MAGAGFLSPYLSGSLPYAWRHITVNKMCRMRHEIKHFLSSLPATGWRRCKEVRGASPNISSSSVWNDVKWWWLTASFHRYKKLIYCFQWHRIRSSVCRETCVCVCVRVHSLKIVWIPNLYPSMILWKVTTLKKFKHLYRNTVKLKKWWN